MKLNVIQPWYREGLQFECTGCGNCCTGGPGYIWISDQELNRLTRFLKMPKQEMVKKYCRKIGGQISLKEKQPNSRGEYDCIFLKEIPAEVGDGSTVQHSKRICTIYPVRPLQCRTWPFWDGNMASRKAWDEAAKRCPGMNRGKVWGLTEIDGRRTAEEWPEE